MYAHDGGRVSHSPQMLSLAEAQAIVRDGGRIEGVLSLAHPAVTTEIIDSLGGSAISVWTKREPHRHTHTQVISNYGVGCDHIDAKAARERGIPVGNTPDVLTDSTADMAFALLMAVARRIPQVC